MPNPEDCEHGFYQSRGCTKCAERGAEFIARLRAAGVRFTYSTRCETPFCHEYSVGAAGDGRHLCAEDFDEAEDNASQDAAVDAAPVFENVACSQCGKWFGPGDHGFSHCKNHKGRAPRLD